MVNNANFTLLTGRLTHAPELRQNQNGRAFLSNSIAVQRNYKNKNGEFDTDFINFIAGGATAEFIAKYFEKGSPITISGALHQSTTQVYDEKGVQKNFTTLNVMVDQASFVPGAATKPNNTGATPAGNAPAQQAAGNAAMMQPAVGNAAPMQQQVGAFVPNAAPAQTDFTPIPTNGNFPFGTSDDDDGVPF